MGKISESVYANHLRSQVLTHVLDSRCVALFPNQNASFEVIFRTFCFPVKLRKEWAKRMSEFCQISQDQTLDILFDVALLGRR